MSYKHYPITGIREGWGPGGQVPVRRDFNEWTESTLPRDRIQVSLYLLALKRFQGISPEKRESYFQIAGIHGFPYTSWDEPWLTEKEVGRRGYCVHANSLFPPWHRPYLLLYEQRLYEIMVEEIVPEYPAYRAEYLDAARAWRLPFWDWAKHPQVPRLARWRKIKVALGNKPPAVMDNPLHQFRMPNDQRMGVYGVGSLKYPDGDASLNYGECYATTRCPDAKERKPGCRAWTEGVVHNERVDEFLTTCTSVTDFPYGTAAELVYRLLTYQMGYPHFATLARDIDASSATASQSKVTHDLNLEFLHNNVHYWVGGDGGHMSQIPVAAFDPIFWLHHCNIDRLFALWQTLNPGKWFQSDFQRFFDQTAIGSGEVITSRTPLRPFHKDECGTVWTPDEVRDWYKLGYTYPELCGKQISADILRMVNDTYGITRREALRMAKTATVVPRGVDITETDASGVKLNDYALSIRYSKFALGGHPFNIELFLRPEGALENTFRTEDFVTNVFNFSQPPEDAAGREVCGNCREGQRRGVRATAYVPLTSHLLRMVQQQQLSDLGPTTVEGVLRRMYWRVKDLAGRTIPEEKWRCTLNLEILVSKTQMRYAEDPTVRPTFPDPEVIPTLGTGCSGASSGASSPTLVAAPSEPPTSHHISVDKITQLMEAVPTGGSLVFESPTLDPAVPAPGRETGTGLALLCWDPAHSRAPPPADPHDAEHYDLVLGLVLRNRRRVVQGNSRRAGGAYGVTTELAPRPWFARRDAQLRVDLERDQLVVYVDGCRVGAVRRTIRKEVTHVRYYVTPAHAQPVMARDITVTIHKEGIEMELD